MSWNMATRTPLKLRWPSGWANGSAGLIDGDGRVMVETGEHTEEESTISDVASDGAGNGEGEPTHASRHIGDAAGRGTEADHIAKVGRIAQGTSHVTAVGERSHAAGESGGAASRAAAAGFREIVRIVSGAEDLVEGLGAEAKFGDIRFAEDDGAGGFLALNDAAIEIGDVVFVERGAVRGAKAGGFMEIFDGDGKAVQGTERIGLWRALRRLRWLAREVDLPARG